MKNIQRWAAQLTRSWHTRVRIGLPEEGPAGSQTWLSAVGLGGAAASSTGDGREAVSLAVVVVDPVELMKLTLLETFSPLVARIMSGVCERTRRATTNETWSVAACNNEWSAVRSQVFVSLTPARDAQHQVQRGQVLCSMKSR